MNETKRGNFSGSIGFVLAAAGSAVGLGNLWRFPYLAAQYGGGTFLLVYLILAVTFGFALMIAEIGIGRKTGLSAIGAYEALDKRFGFVGVLTALVPIIILPYYSVIGGWVIKYFVTFISGSAHAAADDSYFGGFIGSPVEPIGWFFLFIALTAIIVLFGVEKGIEKVSKVMMPILAVLTIGIAVYVVTRPGAMDGVLYYIKPNLKDFSPTTVFAAMGQLFYSMSLAMGIMVTYGSYMKKDNHMEKSVRQIELFDTAIAFMAGLMIVPAAYTFYGGSTEELKKGPTLMFVILPKVFDQMPGIMGTVIGVAFFLLVFFAALTSSISLMETVVSNNLTIKVYSDGIRVVYNVSGSTTINNGVLTNKVSYHPVADITIPVNINNDGSGAHLRIATDGGMQYNRSGSSSVSVTAQSSATTFLATPLY